MSLTSPLSDLRAAGVAECECLKINGCDINSNKLQRDFDIGTDVLKFTEVKKNADGDGGNHFPQGGGGSDPERSGVRRGTVRGHAGVRS